MGIEQNAFNDSRLTRQEKVFINSFVERGILKRLVFPSAASIMIRNKSSALSAKSVWGNSLYMTNAVALSSMAGVK